MENKAPLTKTRIVSFDVLRIVAILNVIIVHAASQVFVGSFYSGGWIAANFFESFFRLGVPSFLMISGSLHLNPEREIEWGKFYKKVFLHIIVPLLFWSLAYYLLIPLIQHEAVTFNFMEFLARFLDSNVYWHLYFMYIIIGLYILTPFLRVFIKGASQKLIRTFLLIWVVNVAIVPVFTRITGLRISANLLSITGFVGYYIAGYFLTRTQPKWHPAFYFLVYLAASSATFLATHYSSAAAGSPVELYYDKFSPNIMLAAVAFFQFIRSINFSNLYENNKGFKVVVTTLGKTTYGVFFIHLLVQSALLFGVFGFQLYSGTGNGFIYIPLTSLAVYVISTVIVLVLGRIPLVKNLVS